MNFVDVYCKCGQSQLVWSNILIYLRSESYESSEWAVLSGLFFDKCSFSTVQEVAVCFHSTRNWSKMWFIMIWGTQCSWENQRSYLHALTVSLTQFQACFILGGCLNSVYPDLRTAQSNCVWPLCLDSMARSPRVTLWGAERPMAQWSPFPRLQSRPYVPSGSFRNSSLGRRPSSQGNAAHLRNSRCPSVRWFGREFESFSPTAFHHPVPHCIYYLWLFPPMNWGARPGSGLPSWGAGWGASGGRTWP